MTADSWWARRVVTAAGVAEGVRIVARDGVVAEVTAAVAPTPGEPRLDTVLPGAGNAHSHAFHRALRGRTHGDGGDFWRWREEMYRVAGSLDPESYYTLARCVFTEMLLAGWTAVTEFHYVHHRPDGTPYPGHAMERALVAAAADAGIRLTLLDTCYLAGGPDRPLSAQQQRFSDASAKEWLRRWELLYEELGDVSDLVVGAAVHSVRAVPWDALEMVGAALPAGVPLHAHLSEQPQENADSQRAYGMSPTAVLRETGILDRECVSVVHATHLSDADVADLGRSGVGVVVCPSTEGDLGDGIPRARDLSDGGAFLALGTDQNAMVDPFVEVRGLELGARVRAGTRGVFSPAELAAALGRGGYRAAGWPRAELTAGDLCDFVEIDAASPGTSGCAPDQLLMAASGADVMTVVVGGKVVVEGDPRQRALRRRALARDYAHTLGT